jgi:hypothetical protein
MSSIFSKLQEVEIAEQSGRNGKTHNNIFEKVIYSATQGSDLRSPRHRMEITDFLSEVSETSFHEQQSFPASSDSFIGLAKHVRETLRSIRAYALSCQGKFKEEAFGTRFCEQVTEHIDTADSGLSCFLEYNRIKSAVQKTNTVHNLLEMLLGSKADKLKERNITLVRKQYDKELPETSVQDEQLRYILHWALEYAILSTASSGKIGILTRSLDTQEGGNRRTSQSPKRRYIEVLIASTGVEQPAAGSRTASEWEAHNGEARKAFILPFIEEILRGSQGMLRSKAEPEKNVTHISLLLPIERRKVTHIPGES